MDSIQNRITAFVKLGAFLSQFSQEKFEKATNIEHNDLFFDGFKHQIKVAQEKNSWFTKDNIIFALNSWSKALTKNNLEAWISKNSIDSNTPKTVAIVMAGNIPLVGFHDFLSVLISGHSVLVKQSSSDKHLLPFLAKYLEYVDVDLKGNITFTEQKAEDLEKLSEDIFRYFGLGCRSVSKLYVPRAYDFNNFFNGMFIKKDIINNAKYANNYDYNKAVYLMSLFDLLENGFLMIKEDESYSSPIATIFYEYYDNPIDLKIKLHQDKQKIQCIVAKDFIENEIAFGETQYPQLWDYADGVNTLEFLSKL